MDLTGFGSIADLATHILDRFVPDPAQKAQATMDLLKAQQEGEFKLMDQQLAMAQMQGTTNTAEAGSQSIFVAGWRPFVGWVCGAGFAMVFVVGPLLEWIANLFGHAIKFPILDASTLTTLLLGMLGLGTMRTVEKVQGAPDTAKLK